MRIIMSNKSDYWLMFNTSMCNWIVKICYMHKHLNDTSKREYHIDFNPDNRYSIEVNTYKDGFRCKLLRCDKPLAIIDFDTPIQFCKKLWNATNPQIQRFNRLILNKSGFKISQK